MFGLTLLGLKPQQPPVLEWLCHGIARERLYHGGGNPPVTGPCSIDQWLQSKAILIAVDSVGLGRLAILFEEFVRGLGAGGSHRTGQSFERRRDSISLWRRGHSLNGRNCVGY